MATVFISYAREDRDTAATLAQALGERGWSVWWDPNIKAGETFDQVIERELDAASCVVVLWSKQSVASEWVKSEASVAAERGVLIPALIDDVRPPLEFRRRQTADLRGWRGEPGHPGFRAVCEAIEHAGAARPIPGRANARASVDAESNRKWLVVAGVVAVCVSAALGAYAALRGLGARTAQPVSPSPLPSSSGANASLSSGTFEFAWPGADCWKVMRDGVEAARSCGAATRVLQAGRYRVEPSSHQPFVPFEITVEAGATKRIDAQGGVFQFDWPGDDCWQVLRGEVVARSGCGDGRYALQAGTYRVKPSSSGVFLPFELSVRRGETTRADAMAALLEFQWPGRDCWKIYRGDVAAKSSCGPGKHALQAGSYRIEPSGARAFAPVKVELQRGQTTRVGS